MNSFFEQLNELKSRVHAGEERMRRVRERLIHFIEADEAVREGAALRHHIQQTPARIPMVRFKLVSIALVLLVFLLAGGSTSFAAQYALPGELLYPVKVGVNEKVGKLLQASPEAKATYEVALVRERLKEATVLSVEGKLDPEMQTELESRFTTQATEAKAHIEKIRKQGDIRTAADITSDLEVSLITNSKILGEAGKKSDDNTRSIRKKVDDELGKVSAVRTNLEEEIASSSKRESETSRSERKRVNASAFAVGKIRDAENTLRSAQTYLEKKRSKVGAQAATDAETRFGDALGLITQAKEKAETGANGEAFNLGNEAIRISQEAQELLKARADLNLNVLIDGHNWNRRYEWERASSSDATNQWQERERSSSSDAWGWPANPGEPSDPGKPDKSGGEESNATTTLEN